MDEWFGNVTNSKMYLSEIGHIAAKMWNEIMSAISPKPGSLSVVVRSYKSAVSKQAHVIDSYFSWQSSFYDNIICTKGQLNRIRKYILNNPQNWNKTEHNCNNIK
jgi:hypothetical protein